MPKKKQPPSLEDLALQTLVQFVTALGCRMLQEYCTCVSKRDARSVRANWDHLKELLYSGVPWCLSNKFSSQMLLSIWKLSTLPGKKTRKGKIFINSLNLYELALHPQLCRLEFSFWPTSVRRLLYKNLHRMTELEYLDIVISFDLKESVFQDAVTSMKNLTYLSLWGKCTDHILSVVSLNCKKLKELDVSNSKLVTDLCVSPLLSCRELKTLELFDTSVSVEGYAQLLMELPLLENIGLLNEVGRVLEHTESVPGNHGPFGLQIIQIQNVISSHLNVLTKMCPKITCIYLCVNSDSWGHNIGACDVAILASLDDLTELKLESCDFLTNNVKQLLKMKGHDLTLLRLRSVTRVDFNTVVQFCPNLETLQFHLCEFQEQSSLCLKKLAVPPFQKLKCIACSGSIPLFHLELLLSNSFNIEQIKLRLSVDIGDEIMANVLLKNPMKKLEKLCIMRAGNLSMRTVQLLMIHCSNLQALHGLEGWDGISQVDREGFKLSLNENNVDLDLSNVGCECNVIE